MGPKPAENTDVYGVTSRSNLKLSNLGAAGFEVTAERNRHAYAIAFFRRMTAGVVRSGVPPLGLHLMMARDAAGKVANMIENLERGSVAPVEMLARRRDDASPDRR